MSDTALTLDSLTIDGFGPLPIRSGASVAELGEAVRDARSRGQAAYPVGGGTMLDLGLPPSKPGVAVDLRLLNQVIDYPARDMTITVQAGITIGRLQQILQAERQRLPVDIPLPDRATLGGAIATNASGPRRYGLGTLRDYVIGISVVNDEGVEIKGGGRVVKNVAGYDLMKLYTGSLGTLGIITQVTLKLKPLPEASRLVVLPVSLDQASAILDGFQASRTRPVCIEMIDPAASAAASLTGESKWHLLVGFEDNIKAVAWQIEQLRQELTPELRASLRECTDEEAARLWPILRDFPLRPDADLTFKANLLSSAVVDFCRAAAASAPAPVVQAHGGNGIVLGHCRGLTLEQAGPMLEMLGTRAAGAQGNLVVTRCPSAWKAVLPVWGRGSGDHSLMKAVKEKLDPRHIFNPGRFVDGI